MKKLTLEQQAMAVKKVLEEMKYAENYLNVWNIGWWEQLSDAHCLDLYNDFFELEVRKIEEKYFPRYELANAFYSEKSIGVPLIKETLFGEHMLTGEKNIKIECEFGAVKWFAVKTNKSEREFDFDNYGNISFKKSVDKGKKYPKQAKQLEQLLNIREIDYKADYNVLSDDFSIEITIYYLNSFDKFDRSDKITISLKENIVTQKFNDIELIQDLTKQTRLVRINKKHTNQCNNSDIEFCTTLNPDGSSDKTTLTIKTYNGSGKVNSTYVEKASKEKFSAKFYSKKGVEFDSPIEPLLLDITNPLHIPSRANLRFINTDKLSPLHKDIIKKLSESTAKLDNQDFSLEAISQAEKQIIEMVKCIKGELPLKGLSERIDRFLELTDVRYHATGAGSVKTLKLH